MQPPVGKSKLALEVERLSLAFLAKLPDKRLERPPQWEDDYPSTEILKETAKEEGLSNCLGIYGGGVEVSLDNTTNPAVAVFFIGNSSSDQIPKSISVYQRIGNKWVNRTPPKDRFDYDHNLKVKCGDDLGTTIVVKLRDPLWNSLVLYPDNPMCKVWIELKRLLSNQDGAALTSLLCSREGSIKGHAKRLAKSLEQMATSLEETLTQWTEDEIRRTAS